MYVQDNYYSPEEYGTRDVPEYREPCGAFYGMPFAGEGEQGERNLYDLQQVRDYLPDRWLSDKDERVLELLRIESENNIRYFQEKRDTELITEAEQTVLRWNMSGVEKERAIRLITDFFKYCKDVGARRMMVRWSRQYFVHGDLYLLNDICSMFERHCGICIPRYK